MVDKIRNHRVLIFPGGTEAGLEIHQALQYMKDITLVMVGNSLISHARFVGGAYEIIPSIHEHGCLEALNDIIERHNIDAIFPAHDDVLLFLARNRESLKATLLCPETSLCEMLLHKSRTYDYFRDILQVPRLYRKTDTPDFPLFAKRERGEGGQGALKIETMECFTRYVADPDYIVCEYLPGQEFTIDCLSDHKGQLLFAGARERRRIRLGMSVNSIPATPLRQHECEQYAHIIADKLRLRGAWFFQMKENCEEMLTLLEIAPRIAGTMALNRVRGVNFPLLSLYAYRGMELEILLNEDAVEIDRGYANRYRHNIDFDTVFLDFDDILYMHGKLVPAAISFLFHCKNEHKAVILITRHDSYYAEPLQAILGKFGLETAFDAILHVKMDESKADVILTYLQGNDRRAIFVDDSFNERKRVAAMCAIPTFDLSMLELLTGASA